MLQWRNSQASLNAVAQAAAISKSQAVIEFEMDGTIITANRNFLDALGYRLEEIKGKHHSMFAAPDVRDGAEYRKFWADLNRGEFQSGEYKRLGKGGNEVWIQASYNPVLDRSGKPCRVIKFASDITAKKLRSMEDAGKIAAIGRAQAVIEFNLDGTITTACSSRRKSATATPIANSGRSSTAANFNRGNSSASERAARRYGSSLPTIRFSTMTESPSRW
jgi:methyl-accepting chemotaxis protein